MAHWWRMRVLATDTEVWSKLSDEMVFEGFYDDAGVRLDDDLGDVTFVADDIPPPEWAE